MTAPSFDSLPPDQSPNESIGPVEAIAAHLNQTIATEGMTFEVSLDEQILKITVKTEKLLEADSLSKSVRDELLKLKLTNITSVQLYKQKLRRNNCYKLDEFTLIPTPVVEPVKTSIQSQPSSTTDRKIQSLSSHGSNPHGSNLHRSSSRSSDAQRVRDQKPMQKINQTRQIGLLLLFIGLTVFGIWLTVTRFSRWLLSPVGFIGAAIGVPILFKYYGMLFKLWQALVEEKENYG